MCTRVICETCDGHGQVISDRSVRAGHTHGNDPDREDVDCEDCGGTGEGEATASDLDGKSARYAWLTGSLVYERKNDTLTLESDEGCAVVNLQPCHLQLLPCHS